MVKVLACNSKGRRFNFLSFCCQVMTLGKLFTCMYLCYQAVQFGTSHAAVMSCDWEGNHTYGVALATNHRLKWFIRRWAQGLSKGHDHPINTPHAVWYSYLLPPLLKFYVYILYDITRVFCVTSWPCDELTDCRSTRHNAITPYSQLVTRFFHVTNWQCDKLTGSLSNCWALVLFTNAFASVFYPSHPQKHPHFIDGSTWS